MAFRDSFALTSQTKLLLVAALVGMIALVAAPAGASAADLFGPKTDFVTGSWPG